MIICDLCKRDPTEYVVNEALKNQPWGVLLAPPPGNGFAEKRLCWVCTMRVFTAWLDLARVSIALGALREVKE